MVDEVPVPIFALTQWAVDQGFVLDLEEHGGMGGHHFIYSKIGHGSTNVSVEIAGDRGRWSVGLKVGEMDRFIDTRVWEAYLDRTDIGAVELEHGVEIIWNRLNDAMAAAEQNHAIQTELIEMGRVHMLQILKW